MNPFAAIMASLPPQQGGRGSDPLDMFPPEASVNAANSDWVYYFIFWVSAASLLLICLATVYFMWRYRRSRVGLHPEDSPHHSTKLEVVWSVIPAFFLVAFFWYGFEDYVDRRTIPQDAYEIKAQARKWSWTFVYPNGHKENHLRVPAGKNVKVRLESADVLHSFYVPAFRVKMDVVPGRYGWTWFRSDSPGEYPLFCAEYCGDQHSQMDARVIVLPEAEFEKWLAESGDLSSLPPEKAGEKIYQTAGCLACHTTNGVRTVGPGFGSIAWGAPRKLADGSSVPFDENYVRESILDPNAKVAEGFTPNVMPANFAEQLNDEQIDWLIAYIESISQAD